MFDKYKKYRIIGVIVVIVAIAVLFAANIRIRSVRQRINLWWADENKKNYFHQFTKESRYYIY